MLTLEIMQAPTPAIFTTADSQDAYRSLLTLIESLAGTRIEQKKTCLHVVAGKAAFLGVHPRKAGLRLNIVLARPLQSARVVKSEQVSRSRHHNEVDVTPETGIDDELRSWIIEAYNLQPSIGTAELTPPSQ
jgi:hypothetical protein